MRYRRLRSRVQRGRDARRKSKRCEPIPMRKRPPIYEKVLGQPENCMEREDQYHGPDVMAHRLADRTSDEDDIRETQDHPPSSEPLPGFRARRDLGAGPIAQDTSG